MTVRTWVTLSVLVLVALTVAVFVRFLAPVDAPPVIVRAGETRLEGALVEACWTQRGGDLRCEEGEDAPRAVTIPADGELRVIVAYPAQPEDGTIEIEAADAADGESVLREDWDDEVAYELDDGTYTLVTNAEYPGGAFVRYRFAFNVR